mmetsp:Transcript_7779/g.7968  ORF Transcript_7779/g.7968 Transcript_7779/m.7968 type:complete len:97 (+) Transcript_7779:498-788(+)
MLWKKASSQGPNITGTTSCESGGSSHSHAIKPEIDFCKLIVGNHRDAMIREEVSWRCLPIDRIQSDSEEEKKNDCIPFDDTSEEGSSMTGESMNKD